VHMSTGGLVSAPLHPPRRATAAAAPVGAM
jgi:hypothetical protein